MFWCDVSLIAKRPNLSENQIFFIGANYMHEKERFYAHWHAVFFGQTGPIV